MESFLTGLTGVASLLTLGLLPVYGEPDGTTWEERRHVLGEATGDTAAEVALEPLKPLKRGVEVVAEGALGVALPWWAWAALVAGGVYLVKRA